MKCHDGVCRGFGLNPAEIPRGAIVAVADLADCILMDEQFIATQSEQEILVGDWQPGRFAWKLENVVRAIAPVSVKGKQGLWNLEI